MTLLENLIRDKISNHPLPWSIDYDWLVEVYDANGAIVMKLMDTAQARELIRNAERLAAEDAIANDEFEEMMNADTAD